MDDNDHWYDAWNDRPMWLDIVIVWLSIALLVVACVAQRILRDWRAERRATKFFRDR